MAHRFGNDSGTEPHISHIDFAAGRLDNDADRLAYPGPADDMGLHLRASASQKYRALTGDRTGALQMLALRAPGAVGDVAPTWMVKEATEHSKAEWQRADRIIKEQGGGGGRGRGCRDQGGGGGDSTCDSKGRGRGPGRQGGDAAAAQSSRSPSAGGRRESRTFPPPASQVGADPTIS